MTKINKAEMIAELMEIRLEIARVNDAAGHTVFNPAATDAIESVMLTLGADRAELRAIRERHGKLPY